VRRLREGAGDLGVQNEALMKQLEELKTVSPISKVPFGMKHVGSVGFPHLVLCSLCRSSLIVFPALVLRRAAKAVCVWQQ
jgi:hypothetical protein